MKNTLWFVSILLILLCVACGSGTNRPMSQEYFTSLTPTAKNAPEPLPLATLIPESVVTGTAGDGQPITITIVRVQQDDRSTHKIRVSRGNLTSWLKSSDTPDKFGCEIEVGSTDTFGCYFGSVYLADLDRDGESEILSVWEHDGTGGYKSFHLYRWDGETYQLIGEFYELQLQAEIQVVQGGRQDIILRYNVGPHQLPIPWFDVFTLVGGQLVAVNDQYSDLYQGLLERYREMLPDYEIAADNGWPEALDELKRRIAMVEKLIGNLPREK